MPTNGPTNGTVPSIQTASGAVRPTAEVGRAGVRHLSGQVEEYDPNLRGPRGVKVFEEMRRNDPVVATGLRAITWIIGRVSWNTVPAGDKADDKAAAEFLESCLDDMSHPFDKIVRDALTCLPFGWSYNEVVYKVRNGPEADPPSRYDDGKIGIRKTVLISQSTLDHWQLDDKGGIQGLWQYSMSEGQATSVYIPIEKALLFRLEDEGNNPEGVSLLRPVYRPWYAKKMMEEIEAIGIERDMTGVPVIDLPVGFTDADKEVAKQYLEQYSRDDMSGWVLPRFGPGDEERWNVRLLGAGSGSFQSGGGQGSNGAINRYANEIARAFLTGFLMLGSGQSGSWALSRDQRDLFQIALEFIVDMVADIINRFLIPSLFRLNSFGKLSGLPTVQPGKVAKADADKLATALQKLAAAGFVKPDAELESYIRKEVDLPEKTVEQIEEEEAEADAERAKQEEALAKAQPAPSATPPATPTPEQTGTAKQTPGEGTSKPKPPSNSQGQGGGGQSEAQGNAATELSEPEDTVPAWLKDEVKLATRLLTDNAKARQAALEADLESEEIPFSEEPEPEEDEADAD